MISLLMQHLEKNGFSPHRCATGGDARALVLELIPEGADVGIGGSETIRELGLTAVRSGPDRPCMPESRRSVGF